MSRAPSRPARDRCPLSAAPPSPGLRPGRLILLLALLVLLGLTLDAPLARLAREAPTSVLAFFHWLTDWGQSGWMLMLSGLEWLGLWLCSHYIAERRLRLAAGHMALMAGFVFMAVAGSGIAVQILKQLIGRARPPHLDALGPTSFSPLAFETAFASMPSGHTTTAFALTTALYLLRPSWRAAALLLAAAIGLSRIMVGAHYLSDTIAGALLGHCFTLALARGFAARRLLFALDADGRLRLRGQRLLADTAHRLKSYPRQLSLGRLGRG